MDNSYTPPIDFYRAETRERFPWLNVALFLATCLSTLLVGALSMAYFNDPAIDQDKELQRILAHPTAVLAGLPFSLAIMGILFAHEMGHYLMCRYYGIDASLPYFIPFPFLSLVGTLGAFIRIRGPFQHRSAWLEVGIAGPIAGFVLAVPALILGLSWSKVVPLTAIQLSGGAAPLVLGEPLIYKLVVSLLGITTPEGMVLFTHPVADAAWFGFLATALNLIPAGQLDGGHVVYGLFQRRGHRILSFGFMAALVPLGYFYWSGWWFWLVLLSVLGFRLGFTHPPSLDDSIPLERRDIWLGWIALAIFILCFMPTPIAFS